MIEFAPDVQAEAQLTPAELRVMKLVAHGYAYAKIAHKLDLSEQTIKNHMASARFKLDADSAIGVLVKLGWVYVPDLGNLQAEKFTQCGWIGTCGRPYKHRGHHGGFREHHP